MTVTNLLVNQTRDTSRLVREAIVWRELFLQALTMLAGRDAELREAVKHLVAEQRELLLQGLHEFGCADREFLLLTLSLLDTKQRRRDGRAA